MESIVNCPACGEEVRVMLDPETDSESLELFDDIPGTITALFSGRRACKCGQMVFVVLHVAALGEKPE